MDDRLNRLCVGIAASIRETMGAIDDGAVEIALVVDDHGRMIGTVSDGDIRRGLLQGARLDDPVLPIAQTSFVGVDAGTERAAVLDLMQAHWVNQIPVLDADRRVVGLHVLREVIGRVDRTNRAVIMAGGRGIRLRPLTEQIPKPLILVAGRPILERIVLHMVGSGITRIYLAVNYLAGMVEEHFGDGSGLGCRISYLREAPDEPLGTAGALRLLPPDDKDEPVLVMNGDLVTTFDVGAFLDAHVRLGTIASVGTREYVHDVPFGVVTRDGDRVHTLREKPAQVWEVNAGIYAIQSAFVDLIPEGSEISIVDVIAGCLDRGQPVGAVPLEGEWVDVGRLEDLRRARGDS